MSKIIIRGNFTVETDDKRFKGIKQPLECLELNLTMPIPYRIDRLRSSQKTNKEKKQ